MIRLYFLLFTILLTQNLFAKTDKYRCILRDEPSTTMTIAWNQVSGGNAIVYYGTEDFQTNFTQYPNKQFPQRSIMAKGMNNQFARLKNLVPNTVYYFVIKDSDGLSHRFSFKTLPDDHRTKLSILAGGDSRNHRRARQNANKMVAKLKPHFVLFAGDMTGGDSGREWQEWLEDWQLTITKSGRITAVVPARGNHERSDASIIDMFDVRNNEVYYDLNFCRGLLSIYTLNSMHPSSKAQKAWLEQELREDQQVAWRMAQYHHPMRPHTRRKYEQEYLRRHWGPLFFKYQVQLALECDSHMSKLTWPVRSTQDKKEKGYDEGFVRDPNGTVFIGEGGWGAPLREADDDKRWTRASGSFNQVKWILVDLNQMEVRTVKTDNVNEVGELTEANRYVRPANIDLWKVDGQDYISINNKKRGSFVAKEPQILMRIKDAKANVNNNKVELSWLTVHEVRDARFKVEVSSNKIQWRTIAEIQGTGEDKTGGAKSYRHIDYNVRTGGKYYYRIVATNPQKQVFSKQNIAVRVLGTDDLELLKVDVNSKSIPIDLKLDREESVMIEIFNTKRKRVFVRRIQLPAGSPSLPMSVKHLPPGYYLFEISYRKKLLKKNLLIYRRQ